MMPSVRTLNVGLRVTDLELSLAFYRAIGYTVVGAVDGTAFGTLIMLQLPGDPFVAVELESSWSSGRPATPTA
jgi:lactoylglutathione lyase